jgi:hypothetical protein
MLLEEGADVNQKTKWLVQGLPRERLCLMLVAGRDRQAPIHMAAYHGDLSILEVLVARGADVHVQDK